MLNSILSSCDLSYLGISKQFNIYFDGLLQIYLNEKLTKAKFSEICFLKGLKFDLNIAHKLSFLQLSNSIIFHLTKNNLKEIMSFFCVPTHIMRPTNKKMKFFFFIKTWLSRKRIIISFSYCILSMRWRDVIFFLSQLSLLLPELVSVIMSHVSPQLCLNHQGVQTCVLVLPVTVFSMLTLLLLCSAQIVVSVLRCHPSDVTFQIVSGHWCFV